MDSYDATIIDTLASDQRVALVYHVSGSIGERTLDLDYLLVARVENHSFVEFQSYPAQPEVLRRFWTEVRH